MRTLKWIGAFILLGAVMTPQNAPAGDDDRYWWGLGGLVAGGTLTYLVDDYYDRHRHQGHYDDRYSDRYDRHRYVYDREYYGYPERTISYAPYRYERPVQRQAVSLTGSEAWNQERETDKQEPSVNVTVGDNAQNVTVIIGGDEKTRKEAEKTVSNARPGKDLNLEEEKTGENAGKEDPEKKKAEPEKSD